MSEAVDLIRQALEAGVTLKPRLWVDDADRLEVALRDKIKASESAIIQSLLDDRDIEKARREGSGDFAPSASPVDAETTAAEVATERAAIIAEGEHRNPWQFVPHKLPPSWPAPEYGPTPGAACSCCAGTAWWCEATAPKGWRCSTCHPPAGAGPGTIRELRT